MLVSLMSFLIACTAVAAVPGQSTALIIRQSIRGGRRAGIATVLGNETGVFFWGCAAAFGLTALLSASQIAYDGMRVVGVCVLLWFGVQSFRSARRMKHDGVDGEHPEAVVDRGSSALRSYRAGVLTNLANPKAAIFAMSFLPQFVPAHAEKLPTMILLAGVWACYEIGYYSVYVWSVHRMSSFFSRRAVRRRMEQISGTVMLGLAARMVLENG
ncbi:LysE family translocator [Nocardia sp. NEAU-G5]|uniref:LysE family translocator n=1 Tax=Nocardia albiluteola TaxID=2842303 RepID=A0ABS6B939_9NOCA|nr:LysE family translocator [Nocardia albiluteola]MBU3066270.1 LysE family translocator [Nocardia albiluteola]